MNIQPPELILASASRYRAELLGRIAANFRAVAADVDEVQHPGEAPVDMAARLAQAKAQAVATRFPGALVIGSDQVPAHGAEVLRKPGSAANAARQLRACSGGQVVFYTGVYVTCINSGYTAAHVDTTTVTFRELSDTEIAAYLALDEPWDCAGSFRSEAAGSLLFRTLDTHDPTALVGLPLIWLGTALRAGGLDLLTT